MLLELAYDLVGQQIDDRIEVGVLLRRSRRDSSRFENSLAALPILVDLENQMHLAGLLQHASQMRELFFRVLPERIGRFQMTKGDVHRDLGSLEPLLPFGVARGSPALLAGGVFHAHANWPGPLDREC